MHQSFLNYKTYRFGVLAALLSLAVIFAYTVDSPRQPPNGGTWLGYVLGTLGAVIILFLIWFSVRKRSYRSAFGSVTAWLSAHVYLGLALLVIVTLHTGFEFGWNIHTLTYVLMCIVIASGCWGVYTYIRYPGLIAQQRKDLSAEMLFRQVKELDQRAQRLAANLDVRIHDLVADAIRRTALGGDCWEQLSAEDGSRMIVPRRRLSSPAVAKVVENKGQHALIDILAGKQALSRDADEIACLRELLEITGNKATILRKMQRKIQLKGLLQIWLYIHLPLSFALLVCLVIHVTVVFLYW